jgi:hypothetical protein
MEWCWDPAPTFATEVLGADPGYCLKPGDGCHQTRATCKMTIDCDCQDCDDSVRCGAPNPLVWTGTAKTYEYPHATGCNQIDRADKPAWTVIMVSRMPTDQTSKCSKIKKTSGLGYLHIKETCQAAGTQFGSKSVKRTVCHNDECTSCDDDLGITYAMEFPAKPEASHGASDACMVAVGFSHVSQLSYKMDDATVVTDPDSATLQSVNPTCFQSPPTPPTPAPTPAEWATCEGCIAGGVTANQQWCWGEIDPVSGKKGPAHCATPGGIDCSVARSTCPMDIDCACSACDDSERCGGPKKKGGSSKAGIGVGLGLGIPAMAAGLFFFQKKRLQERAMSMGTANQALTGTGAGATSLEPADYAQL